MIFGGLGGEVLPVHLAEGEIGSRNNEDPPFGEQRGIAGDFLHGGAGDDAIAGGEAIWHAYTQLHDRTTGDLLPNAYRSDWTRPFNPGDLLHFGADTDSRRVGTRQGEFALYDEYDPRRTIMLQPDGEVDKTGGGLMWFLNLASDEGPTLDGCVATSANGTCTLFEHRSSDGGDVLFGDLGNDWLVGGTGRDTMYGGWGNDLLNADDVMTMTGDGEFTGVDKKIDPSPNDTPDTHPLYQDRAMGGAGLDILIGNTGGDRLIDWVGEFNSYIVPFAPFGIATVSRQVPPWLYEFLYALSASQGADPTRDSDQTLNDPDLEARNGEPHGELGLITQKDHGLWQEQTGGPSDPQPGNIPGGRRDVLRSADFGDGLMQAFVRDTGTWTVTGGALSVAAASLGQDAVAVWYHDQYLPVYFEVVSRIRIVKPTGGWNANAYVIFDYFAPDDFKFAGLNDSTNKLEVGYRDASGWHVTAQSAIQGGVRYDKWYDLLIAVNGVTVTVVLDGTSYFTHAFSPRIIDGESYGLNKGLLGFGSNNSRGLFDNMTLQILPPTLTLDRREDFADGTADWLTATDGEWQVSGGLLTGARIELDHATARADLGAPVGYDAYLELEAVVRATSGRAGLVFDHYGPTDFKFVFVDALADLVLLGHRSGSAWVIDAQASKILADGVDHVVNVSLKGASVTVSVDGSVLVGHGYNAALVDGEFGVLTTATGTFDNVRVRTNSTNFDEYHPGLVPIAIGDATVTEGNTGTTSVQLTITLATAATEDVVVGWATTPGSALAGSDFQAVSGTVTFTPGQTTATITVQIVGDVVSEPTESFYVSLNLVSGPAMIGDGLAVITITNDDAAAPLPVVSIHDASANEGNSGTTVVSVLLTLDSAPTSQVTVNWGTLAGSAVAGVDFVAASGTATFSAGQTSTTIQVTVVGDTDIEPSETFQIMLSMPLGMTIGDGGALVTIVNDDSAPTTPTVSIADATVNESAGTVTLTLTLDRPSNGTTTVNWATSTATAGTSDFVSDSGQATFANGTSTGTFTIGITDDSVDEPNETFTVTLSSPSGLVIADGTAIVTIVDDDLPATGGILSIGDASVTEGDKGGGTWVTLTVTRTGSTADITTANWTTIADTASAGSDFQDASGSLYFAAGQTVATVRVRVYPDREDEGASESFTVVLSGVVGGTIGDGIGVVTIVDDDGALLAAAAPTDTRAPRHVTSAAAGAALAEAVAQWVAVGVDAGALATLSFEIDDLDGLTVAVASGSVVTVDVDAAGWGWGPDGIDLLSVLLHEVGHVLGLEHTGAGLMAESIEPGATLTLGATDVAVSGSTVHSPASVATPAVVAPAVAPLMPSVVAVSLDAIPALHPAQTATRTVLHGLGGSLRGLASLPTVSGGLTPASSPTRPLPLVAFVLVGLAILGRRRSALLR